MPLGQEKRQYFGKNEGKGYGDAEAPALARAILQRQSIALVNAGASALSDDLRCYCPELLKIITSGAVAESRRQYSEIYDGVMTTKISPQVLGHVPTPCGKVPGSITPLQNP